MPSPDIDLDKHYGPEHAPMTDEERSQIEIGRTLIVPGDVVTNPGRQLRDTTDSASLASGSEPVDTAALEEKEEQTWLAGKLLIST